MFFLLAGCLSGCGFPASSTPLTEAVLALRAGDYDAFVLARNKAQDVMKTTRSNELLRCTLDAGAVLRKAEVLAIDKFDKSSLFAMPEDERLVYALNVAGAGAALDYAPAALDYKDPYFPWNSESGVPNCPPQDAKLTAAMMASGITYRQAEMALRNVFKSWIDAKKSEYGEDQFQANMKKAANQLASASYPAKWPTKVILKDSDKSPPGASFQELEQSVAGGEISLK